MATCNIPALDVIRRRRQFDDPCHETRNWRENNIDEYQIKVHSREVLPLLVRRGDRCALASEKVVHHSILDINQISREQ